MPEPTSTDEILENRNESFSELLFSLIDERHLNDPDVYKAANVGRNF